MTTTSKRRKKIKIKIIKSSGEDNKVDLNDSSLFSF